ncbi:hypothetical protein AQJ64_31710 [Streptomyces griseoruber]|uniref:Uncharacterized protein n=1 Tax=Streptomyces griseoruber TaxID=1943 RepID=A0A101SQS3_9ACTN|nr:hypothetical protein AQJ64_31710 [Streptomyces griseoruber]
MASPVQVMLSVWMSTSRPGRPFPGGRVISDFVYQPVSSLVIDRAERVRHCLASPMWNWL